MGIADAGLRLEPLNLSLRGRHSQPHAIALGSHHATDLVEWPLPTVLRPQAQHSSPPHPPARPLLQGAPAAALPGTVCQAQEGEPWAPGWPELAMKTLSLDLILSVLRGDIGMVCGPVPVRPRDSNHYQERR